MYPTDLLTLAMADALANDTNSLGAALALKVHLLLAPFAPGRFVDFATATKATFTGSAALAAGAAPQQVGVDPSTGEILITVKEPAGGWRWECTATPAETENVVAWMATDSTNADTWGSGMLDIPKPISAIGHEVSIPSIVLRIKNPFAV